MTAEMCEVADTLGFVVQINWNIREFITEQVYTRYRRKEDMENVK